MAYLAIFVIKNKDFPTQDYGLVDNSFSVDITESIQTSKGVRFTEYPLLDGTTRIDSVSRAPGSFNFNGKIGEVVHMPNGNNLTVKDTTINGRSRLETFVNLLEALRDQAIVLDIITEAKTYENYLIESLGFGISQFGVININFSMKEFIPFGSEIRAYEFDPTELSEDSRNQFALYTLTMKNFKTDKEMIDSFYGLLTDPDISEPYMIKMGSSDIGFVPDITIPSIKVEKPNFEYRKVSYSGLLTSSVYRTYTPTKVLNSVPETIYSTGAVLGNLKLRVTIPRINANQSLVNENEIVLNHLNFPPWEKKDYNYKPDEFDETGKYEIKIELFQNEGLVTSKNPSDILTTPKYSDIYGGVNPINHVADNFENDLMLGYSNSEINKIALCFLRKTSNPNEYAMIPNLLEDTSYGYLYPFKYIRGADQTYLNRSVKDSYSIGFVYLHPELVKRLEDIINTFTVTKGNLLYGKTIKWW